MSNVKGIGLTEEDFKRLLACVAAATKAFRDANDYEEAYKFMATIYRACRVMNISIFGGMYAYLILDKHHTPENVTRFIKECAGVEPNTNSNTPQLLRSALIADVSSKVKTMTEIYKIGLITKAWNNWVQKREIVLLKISGQEKNLKFI